MGISNKTFPIPNVRIYTDGSFSLERGRIGGWGAVIICDDVETQIAGCEYHTSLSRMELLGIIKALERLDIPSNITIFSDNKYIYDSFRTRRTARTSKDRDLWERFRTLASRHRVSIQWVKGHAGNKYNEIADGLAKQAVEDGLLLCKKQMAKKCAL